MASPNRLLLASSSLPCEMIEEILVKTPADSLLRFKSTCKKWYDLISDRSFINNHLKKAPERFLRIDNEHMVQILDPATGIHSDTPVPDEFDIGFFVEKMIHCDGLMLCKFYEHLAVWNPFLRKIKWIEPYDFSYDDHVGIGYDKARRNNYKILRFQFIMVETGPNLKTEIYEFDSASWRTIVAYHDGVLDWLSLGVCVDGNMYWIVVRNKGFDILCFDFSVESFTHKCVCPPLSDTRQLGCYEKDRLSLLTYNEESSEIQVWLTSSLSDSAVHFNNYFSVTTALRFPSHIGNPGYSVQKNRTIMLWGEELVQEEDELYVCINLYEIGEDGVRMKTETGRHRMEEYKDSFICSYVYAATLIPVPN